VTQENFRTTFWLLAVAFPLVRRIKHQANTEGK
jgi:hypothetical protein